MADVTRILAQIILDAQGATAAWNTFAAGGKKAFQDISAAAKQSQAEVGAAFRGMCDAVKGWGKEVEDVGKAIKKVGGSISVGLGAPLALFGKESLKAFEEQEKAVVLLDAALKSTGGTVKVSREEMLQFASDTQKSFDFADEDVINMQRTLLKFQSIHGQVFKDAEKVILDYATSTGEKLPEAAQTIGRALEDPVRGMNLLRRAGVTLTAAQQAVIKSLVETGQVAKAQSLLLKDLSEKVGGAAAAFAATDAGKFGIAINNLNDSMEKVGAIIAPVVTQVAEGISFLADKFNELPDGLKTAIVYAGLFVAALGPILFVVGTVVEGIGALVVAIGFIAPAFAIIGPILTVVGAAFATIVDAIALAGTAIAAIGLWPVLIAAALGAVVVLVVDNWDTIKNKTIEVWNGIGTLIKSIIDGIAGFFIDLGSRVKAGWDIMIAGLRTAVEGLFSWIGSQVDGVVGFFERIGAAAKAAWEWATKAVSASSDNSNTAAAGKARGGIIRGSGSGTSDSIRAWLSNGEFVHRAAAVRKYGIGFMQAINSLRFPMDHVRGFVGGGMVMTPSMRFAGGGLATAPVMGGRPFNLVIDGRSFMNLRAPEDTAEEMVRFARQRQVRSAGRKPDWFGG
jgi:hypothetical protein